MLMKLINVGSLFKKVPDPLILITSDLIIVSCNQHFQQLLDKKEIDICNKSVKIIFPNEAISSNARS